jgi:hypothetical protein
VQVELPGLVEVDLDGGPGRLPAGAVDDLDVDRRLRESPIGITTTAPAVSGVLVAVGWAAGLYVAVPDLIGTIVFGLLTAAVPAAAHAVTGAARRG